MNDILLEDEEQNPDILANLLKSNMERKTTASDLFKSKLAEANKPAEYSNEQLAAGALIAALPAIFGGISGGKRGLGIGAEAGGLGAAKTFETADANNKITRDNAKLEASAALEEKKDAENDIQSIEMKTAQNKIRLGEREEDKTYREKKDAAAATENSKKASQHDESEKRRLDIEKRKRFDDAKANTTDMAVQGLEFTKTGSPLPKNKDVALRIVQAKDKLDSSANRMEEALGQGDLETARSEFARMVFAIKDRENLGANFTDSEQFLASLNLPAFAKDATMSEIMTAIKAKVRDEDYVKVLANLRATTDIDAKNVLGRNNYYIPGASYDEKLASLYGIDIGKDGKSAKSGRMRELGKSYNLDDDQMKSLYGEEEGAATPQSIISALPADRQASIIEKAKAKIAARKQQQGL